jgi:hypothetical protein
MIDLVRGESYGKTPKLNAEGGSRTPTSLRTLRPERSASTSFTTSAFFRDS